MRSYTTAELRVELMSLLEQYPKRSAGPAAIVLLRSLPGWRLSELHAELADMAAAGMVTRSKPAEGRPYRWCLTSYGRLLASRPEENEEE